MPEGEQPIFVLYKELSVADLRKLEANSNDTHSGGGARDLRLPHPAFGHVMSGLLPHTRAENRGKRSAPPAIVNYGSVSYYEEGMKYETEIVYWPPTDARPSEGRIAQVHASPALGGRMPESDQGRVFVMFIKWSTNMVTIHYAYEKDLRGDGAVEWANEVRTPILNGLRDSDLLGKSVQGYIDLRQGLEYCHGTSA